ncbi:hypothetical protein [uncultured Rhodoblastus sp.]|uniref:hypothetical protein n=1 Tax=uncultured Rhodoblastus sp. TaxID=543037 RepID=UPI0025F2F0C6|nr:hypothetical protein [uncultured Rhodoblastus sp.]
MIRTGKIFIAGLFIAGSLSLIGCFSSTGDEYLGRWQEISNGNSLMEIKRNGDGFIISDRGQAVPAFLKGGTLFIQGPMGSAPIVHVKESDTLVGGGYTYKHLH